jgi:hypothetical protein
MGPKPEEVTPEQVRERMADTRASAAENFEKLREQANPRTMLTRQLTSARHLLHGAEQRAVSPIKRASGSAVEAAEHAVDRVPEPVFGALGSVRRQIAQRPALAGLAALLVGAAVALLLPGHGPALPGRAAHGARRPRRR